jgi:hypothetical protein
MSKSGRAVTGSTERLSRDFAWFLAVCVLLLLPLCFVGYGSDNDTFGVLEAGRSTWHLHHPFTSRNPGYWTYEAIAYFLALVGGHIVSNLGSLCVGAVIVWRFLVIAKRLGVRFPKLVAACLIATPVFVIACTSTIDYVWSLFGIVLFAELLIADRLVLAILPAAFAFAVRGANGVLIAGAIGGAIAGELYFRRRLTARAFLLVGVGIAAALLGSPPYIASYHFAGNSMTFAGAMAGPAEMWTTKMRIGRFGYKTLYLFGPVAWVLCAAALAVRGEAVAPPSDAVLQYRRRAVPIFAGIVVMNAVLFFEWSIEISYLIPGEFFLLLLLGITLLAKKRWLTAAFAVAIFSADLLTLQLAVPNIPARSTSARLQPALKPGQLLGDLRARSAVRNCETYVCWMQKNVEQTPDAGAPAH